MTCPTCGRKDVSYLRTQRRWQCKAKHPKRQFSARVNTIFEDSPISLSKWCVALWLLASAKNGISSYELKRSIGVKTQQTAWFMLHRIRLAMQTGPIDKKWAGERFKALLRRVVSVTKADVEAEERKYKKRRKEGAEAAKPREIVPKTRQAG